MNNNSLIRLIYKNGFEHSFSVVSTDTELSKFKSSIENYVKNNSHCYPGSLICHFIFKGETTTFKRFTKRLIITFEKLHTVMIVDNYSLHNGSFCDNIYTDHKITIGLNLPNIKNFYLQTTGAWTHRSDNANTFSSLFGKWQSYKSEFSDGIIKKKWIIESNCSNTLTTLFFLNIDDVIFMDASYEN